MYFSLILLRIKRHPWTILVGPDLFSLFAELVQHTLDTLSTSFSIDCEFVDGVGWSLFKPSFSQSTQFTATPHQNDGCEKPGCYEDIITYSDG